jgi:ABC-type multidrug transport system fused ATPase/permease subunit
MGYLSNARFASVAMDRLYDDWTTPSAEAEPAAIPEPGALAFMRTLAFHGVSFTYPQAVVPAVRNLTFSIARGESIGMVGATGAGKSTLVLLLLGLLEPDAGRVTVDGVDIRRVGRAWRSTIAYVPHPVFVVNDTIRRNIALGVEGADVDEARVREAASLAQLQALVGEGGEGLERPVGERGARLSAGERQRIGVARALYQRAEVLVFDEAMAALDNQTEQAVADAIESLRGDRTLIVVAHRLSTVRKCDRLLFLRDGRIEDIGTYDDLMARSVAFRRMAAVDIDARGGTRCVS